MWSRDTLRSSLKYQMQRRIIHLGHNQYFIQSLLCFSSNCHVSEIAPLSEVNPGDGMYTLFHYTFPISDLSQDPISQSCLTILLSYVGKYNNSLLCLKNLNFLCPQTGYLQKKCIPINFPENNKQVRDGLFICFLPTKLCKTTSNQFGFLSVFQQIPASFNSSEISVNRERLQTELSLRQQLD